MSNLYSNLLKSNFKPALMKHVFKFFKKFELWFNHKFGWFFINGQKAIQEGMNNTTTA